MRDENGNGDDQKEDRFPEMRRRRGFKIKGIKLCRWALAASHKVGRKYFPEETNPTSRTFHSFSEQNEIHGKAVFGTI